MQWKCRRVGAVAEQPLDSLFVFLYTFVLHIGTSGEDVVYLVKERV